MRLPRPINRQPIGAHVAGMVGVALDPFELALHAQGAAPLDLGQDALDEVLVLDRLARGRLPPVPAPVDVPAGDAVDGVLAVGHDDDVAVVRHHVERALDRREFGALVGLPGAWQGFGDVSEVFFSLLGFVVLVFFFFLQI